MTFFRIGAVRCCSPSTAEPDTWVLTIGLSSQKKGISPYCDLVFLTIIVPTSLLHNQSPNQEQQLYPEHKCINTFWLQGLLYKNPYHPQTASLNLTGTSSGLSLPLIISTKLIIFTVSTSWLQCDIDCP